MRADELLALVMQKPFCPFRIHLTNGQAYDIRHPELVAVERSIVWIHFPTTNLPPLGDRSIFISLIHILWGEFIGVSSQTRNGG